MHTSLRSLALASLPLFAAAAAQAQAPAPPMAPNIVKAGVLYYDPHSRTDGITGIGVPAGADAKVNGAATLLLTYERMFHPNIGVELVLGYPPKIKADAAGSVAFLGDDVLEARHLAPTLLVNWHFGQPGDRIRPYLGAGVNYTRFTRVRSRLANEVELGDSTGWAFHGGVDFAFNDRWGAFASVGHARVRSKVVASGATVFTTTIDFRPWTYSAGLSYRF
jgi:outer membrane protein